MDITDELIDKLARLSKLSFDEAQKAAIKVDLANMLTLVEVLQEVDTEGVAPLIHLTDARQGLRADVPQAPLPSEEVLSNAPDRADQFFRVPKIVKKNV